jgi:hypothetical protein
MLLAGLLAGLATASTPSGYRYRSYGQNLKLLRGLEQANSGLVELYSAQTRYQLKSPGTCRDDSNKPVPCEQWVLRLTNEATLKAEESDRPEVFFSGCLHGNEQVGPATLVELALFMVESYKKGSNAWVKMLLDTRSIIMMPMTNSLGYEQNRREENHFDPNRDFPYEQKPKKCMQTITARAVNEVWREHIFQMAVTFHGGMQAIAYEWGDPVHPRGRDASPDDTAQREISEIMRQYAGPYPRKLYPAGRLNDVVYPVAGGMEDWAYGASWMKGAAKPCTPPPRSVQLYGPYPPEKTRYNDAQLRAFNILVEASDTKTPNPSRLGSAQNLLTAAKQNSDAGNGHVSRNMRLSLVAIDMVQPYIAWTKLPTAAGAATGAATGAAAATAAGAGAGAGAAAGMVEVGWDVGGVVQVDAAEVLVGMWPSTPPAPLGPSAAPLVVPAQPIAGGGGEGFQQIIGGDWLKQGGAQVLWRSGSASGSGSGSGSASASASASDDVVGKGALTQLWLRPGPVAGKPIQPPSASGSTSGASFPINAGRWGRRPLSFDGADGGFQTILKAGVRAPTAAELQKLLTGLGSTPARAAADVASGRCCFVALRVQVDSAWAKNPGAQPANMPPQSHVVNARTNAQWLKTNPEATPVRRVRGRLWHYSAPVHLQPAGGGAAGSAAGAGAGVGVGVARAKGAGHTGGAHLVLAPRAMVHPATSVGGVGVGVGRGGGGGGGGGSGGGGVVLPMPVSVAELAKGVPDPPTGSMKQGYLTAAELEKYLKQQQLMIQQATTAAAAAAGGAGGGTGAGTGAGAGGGGARGIRWEWHTIGKSAEGREIKAVCIGQCVASASAPASAAATSAGAATAATTTLPAVSVPSVLYTSLLHSREPMGAMVIATFIAFLAHAVKREDASILALLGSRQLWFVPVLNPDGYEYNRLHPKADVRKNRNAPSSAAGQQGVRGGPGSRKCKANDVGVDLNRNFDVCWGSDREDGSADACSEAFRGSSPMSELESKAIDALLSGHLAVAPGVKSAGATAGAGAGGEGARAGRGSGLGLFNWLSGGKPGAKSGLALGAGVGLGAAGTGSGGGGSSPTVAASVDSAGAGAGTGTSVVDGDGFSFALNFHAFGKYVNVPYSCKKKGLPPAGQWAVFTEVASAMAQSCGYDWGQSWCQRSKQLGAKGCVNSVGLYPVAGEMSDWMLHKHGVFAMSPEVAPEWPFRRGDGFWPPHALEHKIVFSMLAANLLVAWRAGAEYELAIKYTQAQPVGRCMGAAVEVKNVGVRASAGAVQMRMSAYRDGHAEEGIGGGGGGGGSGAGVMVSGSAADCASSVSAAATASVPGSTGTSTGGIRVASRIAGRTSAPKTQVHIRLPLHPTAGAEHFVALFDDTVCTVYAVKVHTGSVGSGDKCRVVQRVPASMCTEFGEARSHGKAFGRSEGAVAALRDFSGRL